MIRRTVPPLLAALLPLLVATGAALAQAPASLSQGPPDPRAGLKGWAVSLDAYQLRPLDQDYDLFGPADNNAAGGLEVSYEFLRFGTTRLAIGLGLLSERTAEQGNAAGELRLEAISYHASALLRFRSHSTVQPYLTAGGGAKRATLELTPRSSTTGGLDDRTVTGFGRASAGVRLVPRGLILKRASGAPIVGVAAALELGAILGATQHFALRPTSTPGGGETPIQVEPVDAGSLGGSALFSRFLLQLVF